VSKAKSWTSGAAKRAANTNRSIRQIARNAVKGGPKSVKKDKRAGAGRSAKG
jgi:hypothetical protein